VTNEPGRAASDNGALSIDELTCTERVAKLVWWLAQGDGVRTIDAATLASCTRQHAWRMLCAISRVVPIYQDDDGFWQVCALKEIDFCSAM